MRSTATSIRNTQGFTVIELLIALALGLLVVAGIVQLFVGNSRTYEVVTAQARLQENARFAFEFLSRPARTAGYYGCAPEEENIVWHLNAPWTATPEYNIVDHVAGWQSNGDGSYSPSLNTLPQPANGLTHVPANGIDVTDLNDDADILVFRSVRQPLARLAATMQPDGNPVVSTPGGQPVYAVNDVVIVSDCEQGALFRVSAVAAAADETTLSRGTAGGNFENSAGPIRTLAGDPLAVTMSAVGRSYGASSTVGVVESNFFFVAESAELDNRDNPVNALWLKAGAAAPVELVQGIEDMQILYGVDTTDDGRFNVNRYLTIDAVGDLSQIVAVRVQLTISSVDPLAELGNQRLTRTFSKTIHVRNTG